jgi:hypothetical protein
MRHKKTKANYRRIVLRLPDLDHTKTAMLNSLTSPTSRRVYQYAIDKFIAWYCSKSGAGAHCDSEGRATSAKCLRSSGSTSGTGSSGLAPNEAISGPGASPGPITTVTEPAMS